MRILKHAVLAMATVAMTGVAVQAAASISSLSTFGTGGFLQPGVGGATANLAMGDVNRGLAYNPSTNEVYLANKGNTSITILNGDSGAAVGTLNMTGVTGGTFAIDQLGVGDDGAIYGSNLTVTSSSSPFKIYRWASDSAIPTVVYSGDPGTSNARFGDSLTVRGSGSTLQVLAGSSNTARVGIFSAFDGTTLNSISAPLVSGALSGANRLGITFGNGNSYYGKVTGTGIGYVTFDPTAGTASQDQFYSTSTTPTTVQNGVGPVGTDVANNYLVGLYTGNSTTQQVQLYDMTGAATGTPPLEIDAKNFPNAVVNANAVGQVAFGNGRFYVLDTNNGIYAFTVAVPEPAAFSLIVPAALALLGSRRRK